MKYKLRMRDLERASGLPASMIRFYLKEGLLPEPERPSPNSALYGEPHVESLEIIKRIKQIAPELPLVQMKRVLELVSQGVEPEVALSLHRSIAQGGTASNRTYSLPELVEVSGCTMGMIKSLINNSILVPLETSDEYSFNEADLEVLKAVSLFSKFLPDGISLVSEVAKLLKQASLLEMQMRNRVSSTQTSEQAAQISYQMQEWGNFWHSYLFARFRLSEIKSYGLGNSQGLSEISSEMSSKE